MASFGGRYRLVRLLGKGGFGEVWLACDEELGDRHVAIKMMRSHLLSEREDVARFQREMRLASRMQHPNIMTVFTTGAEGGVPFMVMEYLKGRDLSRMLAGWSAEEVARIGRETCQALAYAHGLAPGVVHRDIKPGNLFICDGGQLKVTDFGIARAVGGTRLTATGTLIGTYPYMAPEQWMGQPAGFSNDIWAVGCVLYELLSGRLARSYGTPVEYVAAVARGERVPPLPVAAGAPAWLSEAVMAMLAPDAGDRPVAAECVQLLSGTSARLASAVARQAVLEAELESTRRLAEARRLAAAAELALTSRSSSVQVPIALAIEAMRTAPVIEADIATRHAIRTAARQALHVRRGKAALSVAFSPDAALMATGASDGSAAVIDAASGAELWRLDHGAPVWAVAFSPDGRRVVTGWGQRRHGAAAQAGAGGVRVLEAATGAQVTQVDQGSAVLSVRFSPDGAQLATAAEDRTVRLLNAATGAEVAVLRCDADQFVMGFGPGGLRVATATRNGSARLLDPLTGAELACLGPCGPVPVIALSPDGTRVAAGHDDRSTWIVDAATGARISRLDQHRLVHKMAFSPDGATVVAYGMADSGTRVFDVATGAEISRLAFDRGADEMAFSPDGARLAISSASGHPSARVFDVATGAEAWRLDHEGRLNAVAFSPDGRQVATACMDGGIRVFGVAAGPDTRLGHEASVLAVAFSPDGTKVATASGTTSGSSASARVFDAAAGTELWRVSYTHVRPLVTFSPDGALVAIADHRWPGNGSTRVLDAATGTEISRVDHHSIVYAVAFSPDGTRVLSASRDNTVRVFEARAGTEVLCLRPAGAVYAAAFSPDGARIAAGSWLLDARTGDEACELEFGDTVLTVAFSPDGSGVVVGGDHGGAGVFDAATGAEIAGLPHDGPVCAMAFSPDGARVATASEDRAARVFDAATGAEIARLYHDLSVYSVAFSPDGTRVATASADGTARLFDAAAGTEISRLEHGDSVYQVRFSPDGTQLATASGDHTARLWPASQHRLVEQAAARLTRNLTEHEWKRYFPGQPYRKTRGDLP